MASNELIAARMGALAEEMVGLINRAPGFRNAGRAAKLFVLLQAEGITPFDQSVFIERFVAALAPLANPAQRNVASGLSEVRELLAQRDPGVQTLQAVSLWETIIAQLALELQHLARAGQFD